MPSNETAPFFLPFKTAISSYSLPQRFTFPFYYQPHPLCRLAAEELQTYIQNQTEWEHDFGLGKHENKEGIGKMFGVLVVQNALGELGYLAAFSGKLANKNHWHRFVPPVFDTLAEDGFFRAGERVLDKMNAEIAQLERDPDHLACQQNILKEKTLAEAEINTLKKRIKTAKKDRQKQRQEAQKVLNAESYEAFKQRLANESWTAHNQLKQLKRQWKNRLQQKEQELAQYTSSINALKSKRKAKSSALQQQLFESYHFLNQYGETKNLLEIFAQTSWQYPSAGAGECAAPKLLQYAFQHQLRPIAMAEFWWGASSLSAIRKHRQFYPTCRGKCEPILMHMLKGIELDTNPMHTNPAAGKTLEILYEDEWLLAVNKPAEFLAIPGKHIQDSVWLRMKQRFPNATGPLVVHRLDMSTSGIMLIAKSKEIHKLLQQQFLERTIQKRYVALLEGVILEKEGSIHLPLRVDLDNRPHQLVCYKYGKSALTKWKVIETNQQTTRIHFFPITGRTHQLRVHAAHPLGLNVPIVGDDLYGTKGNRLHLHAEWIAFFHPKKRTQMEIIATTPF